MALGKYLEGGGLQSEEIIKSTLFCKVHFVLNNDIKSILSFIVYRLRLRSRLTFFIYGLIFILRNSAFVPGLTLSYS
jgi:hypothetical protein